MYYNDFTKTSRFRWNEEKGKLRSGSSAEEERQKDLYQVEKSNRACVYIMKDIRALYGFSNSSGQRGE